MNEQEPHRYRHYSTNTPIIMSLRCVLNTVEYRRLVITTKTV